MKSILMINYLYLEYEVIDLMLFTYLFSVSAQDDSCPVLTKIVQRCRGVDMLAGDRGQLFLPLCSLHQICYLCVSRLGIFSTSVAFFHHNQTHMKTLKIRSHSPLSIFCFCLGNVKYTVYSHRIVGQCRYCRQPAPTVFIRYRVFHNHRQRHIT